MSAPSPPDADVTVGLPLSYADTPVAHTENGAVPARSRHARPSQLRTVLHAIRRSWIILVVAVLTGVLAGWAVAAVASKSYETHTKVLVTSSITGTTVVSPAQATSLVSDQVTTFAALAETPAVLDPAIEASKVDIASTTLVKDVSASVVPDTSIIEVSVSAGSAREVAELANAISASLIQQIEANTQGNSPVQLSGTVVEPPEIPESASSPVLVLDVAVGFAVGLLVGFLIVAVRESLATDRPAA